MGEGGALCGPAAACAMLLLVRLNQLLRMHVVRAARVASKGLALLPSFPALQSRTLRHLLHLLHWIHFCSCSCLTALSGPADSIARASASCWPCCTRCNSALVSPLQAVQGQAVACMPCQAGHTMLGRSGW